MQAHPAPVLSFFTWLSPRQMPAPQRGAVTHHRARSVGRRSSPAQQHHLTWLLQCHQQQTHPCGIGNQHLRQRLRLPCEQSGLLPLLLLHQALPQVPVLLCWPLPRSHQSKAGPVKPGSLKSHAGSCKPCSSRTWCVGAGAGGCAGPAALLLSRLWSTASDCTASTPAPCMQAAVLWGGCSLQVCPMLTPATAGAALL
jgi:hypothetical protein